MLKLRLRVTVGDVIAVGPGKIALLEAVAETRSISAAARATGMSYRRAWILVDEVNSALRQTAVTSSKGGERGGGSKLTRNGERLVALYRAIEQRATAACAADITALLKLIR